MAEPTELRNGLDTTQKLFVPCQFQPSVGSQSHYDPKS